VDADASRHDFAPVFMEADDLEWDGRSRSRTDKLYAVVGAVSAKTWWSTKASRAAGRLSPAILARRDVRQPHRAERAALGSCGRPGLSRGALGWLALGESAQELERSDDLFQPAVYVFPVLPGEQLDARIESSRTCVHELQAQLIARRIVKHPVVILIPAVTCPCVGRVKELESHPVDLGLLNRFNIPVA
jgi:hypothetical protein